jgi:hypothetical protein
MIELSDEDILRRLTNTEDSTVERKTASDYRDCLKTAVGFSNSLPVDDPGVIFVGVGNDGTVQDKLNLDSLQKDASKELSKAYPPIYSQMKVIRDTKGKEFLAVIVRGSGNRPHFAGPSYVRDGSQTREASEEQFERLIAERNSYAREILKWRDKEITTFVPATRSVVSGRVIRLGGRVVATVKDCNQFYVTLERLVQAKRHVESFPLADVEITFDNSSNRLELRIQRR